jgi:hypothetical protein
MKAEGSCLKKEGLVRGGGRGHESILEVRKSKMQTTQENFIMKPIIL